MTALILATNLHHVTLLNKKAIYAPKNFSPNDYQLIVAFTHNIGDKSYDVKVECAIARTSNKAGNLFVGCKITKENKKEK